jgi:hypothetical protein
MRWICQQNSLETLNIKELPNPRSKRNQSSITLCSLSFRCIGIYYFFSFSQSSDEIIPRTESQFIPKSIRTSSLSNILQPHFTPIIFFFFRGFMDPSDATSMRDFPFNTACCNCNWGIKPFFSSKFPGKFSRNTQTPIRLPAIQQSHLFTTARCSRGIL